MAIVEFFSRNVSSALHYEVFVYCCLRGYTIIILLPHIMLFFRSLSLAEPTYVDLFSHLNCKHILCSL
jgi:hypothetical protein